MYRTVILLLVQLATHIHVIDAQFINNPPDIENRCSDGTSSVNFNWSYATSSSILIVEWKKDGSLIADEPVGLSQPFSPASSYVGRLNKLSNAQISLGSLSIADSGIYTCEVTYTNGNAYISNSISLNVYDEWNNETKIQMTSGNGMVTLSAVFFDLSITYTWKLQNTVIYVGSSLAVKKNGNYTLCVSGGRADCVNSSLSLCASIDVTGFEGCKYSDVELIFGGVSCFLIVLITSIIMLIIQGCKILLEIFGDIKPNKLIIIIVFDLVALIIGLALGFSLKECDQRDLGLGLGLGFGFILAIALVVTLYIYHKKCGSKKENEDENGKKPEDNPQRVGLKS